MSNGQLPDAVLAGIPGGRLSKPAAAAWNAGPAKAGLRPLGPNSSYRTYAAQVYFWNLYTSGRGNLAARPGTSNHGWGTAVDLQAPWMRTWIDRHGARYGWKKTEAFSEWWHVNYVGGFTAPKPKPSPARFLTVADRKQVERLFYHRKEARREAASGKGPRYRAHIRWRDHHRAVIVQRAKHAKGERRKVLRRALLRTNATQYSQLRED